MFDAEHTAAAGTEMQNCTSLPVRRLEAII